MARLPNATRCVLALASVLWFNTAAPASAGLITLTGLVEFSANENGSTFGGQVWNTLGGGDPTFNLYVIEGPHGGAFLNPGNDAGTSISMALSDGSHTFTLHGDPGLASTHFGLNLFFNDSTNPGISVFGPQNGPDFFANSGSTLKLNGEQVTGAGQLSFVSGMKQVTLTDYRWSHPTVFDTDRVSDLDSVSNLSNDFVGQITLNVTSVPEPSMFMLLGTGLFGGLVFYLATRRNRRRSASPAV